MRARDVISVTFFIILLIYGPIYSDITGGLIIRLSYLIILPYGLWFLLGWLWNNVLFIDEEIDNIIERITYGLIGLFLIFQAVLTFTAKNHLDNTMWVRTRDGYDAVGDDIMVSGPDYRLSFILFGLGLAVVLAAAFAGKKKKQKAETKINNIDYDT